MHLFYKGGTWATLVTGCEGECSVAACSCVVLCCGCNMNDLICAVLHCTTLHVDYLCFVDS